MTTAHIDFDSSNPQASQAPTPFSTSALNDLRALRDMIITGLVPGFVQTRTQGTGPDVQRPQFITWNNATLSIGFRWNITWTGFNPTTVQEEWQNDGVPNWVAVGAAQVNTFDGNNNITASTNSGGFVTMIFELWGKLGKAISDLASHISGVGTSVHGLGSMAVQGNASVDINGGAIDGTALGDAVRARVSATRIAEDSNPLTPALNAGVTVDWAYGGTKITTSGTNAITFSGIPAGTAGHVVDVSNFNNVTWPASVDWGSAGAPSIPGRAVVTLYSNDSGIKVFATAGWH